MSNFIKYLSEDERQQLHTEISGFDDLYQSHYISKIQQMYAELREGRTVWLRTDTGDGLEYTKFPILYKIICYVCKNPNLGRIYIHRLKPGDKIYKHKDTERYHSLIQRYHIYLELPDEVVIKYNGDKIDPWSVISFDHTEYHSYDNRSSNEIKFIVFDIFKENPDPV